MNILEYLSTLSRRGTAIVGIGYAGSENPIKNLRVGDSKLRRPPFGALVDSVLFVHNGRKYVRAIDHNEGEQPKVFAVDKIQWIHHNGKVIF